MELFMVIGCFVASEYSSEERERNDLLSALKSYKGHSVSNYMFILWRFIINSDINVLSTGMKN